MGDRANIQITSGAAYLPNDPGVWIYTHWSGLELPKLLSAALKRGKGRWQDPPYLARIIFSEVIRDDIDGETGTGLSTTAQDGSDRVLKVDVGSQTVSVVNEYGDKDWPDDGAVISFDAFAEENYGGEPTFFQEGELWQEPVPKTNPAYRKYLITSVNTSEDEPVAYATMYHPDGSRERHLFIEEFARLIRVSDSDRLNQINQVSD